MKTFKEYLAESKKYYSFKVKVAGDLPEKFKENLNSRLEKYSVATLEQTGKTPIQKLPHDFPEMENSEVTMFEVVTEYPLNGPQLETELRDMGIERNRYKVRTAGQEADIEIADEDSNLTDGALLDDPEYKEAEGVKAEDYYGDEFNTNFLKDLQKTAEERKKELEQNNNADVYDRKIESVAGDSPVGSK